MVLQTDYHNSSTNPCLFIQIEFRGRDDSSEIARNDSLTCILRVELWICLLTVGYTAPSE